ncbi:transglycosylase family protein [Kitasatospora sp. NPDC094015]|uniref:transglycosylase family protein n=1 Tax=Kitasatospora sp. NPDC094015 TaxID=3155205 RepID=UPI003330DE4C
MVFSGSGRHRRPTQTDRAVAAAGVAGVGLALPLLTATGAHAATPDTWQAVAQCETGGNWTVDPGTGRYGGLGLTLRTWVAYGGDEFAAQPDHATPQEQITVAERLLAGHGPSLWPTCGPAAGLPAAQTPAPTSTPEPTPAPSTSAPVRGDGGVVPQFPLPYLTSQPSVPTEGNGTTAPVPPAGQDQPAGRPGTQPSGQPSTLPGTPTGQPTGDPTATTPVTTPDPTATVPGTPVSPSPSGTPTTGDLPVPGATGTTAPTTGLPVDPATTPAPTTAATPDPAATTPVAATTPAPATTYTVAPGDTLSTISNSLTLGGWQHLYDNNSPTVGGNPDLIHPGQVLTLP